MGNWNQQILQAGARLYAGEQWNNFMIEPKVLKKFMCKKGKESNLNWLEKKKIDVAFLKLFT